jgi:hypothetical protein
MTYDTSNVTLSFSVNKPVSQIAYSLDNQMNVTANGNNSLALSDLSNGDHNLTIYAQDDAGLVGASNTLYFIVNEPPWPEPSILSITADIAGASAMLTVFAGFFVYFKKRMPLGKS